MTRLAVVLLFVACSGDPTAIEPGDDTSAHDSDTAGEPCAGGETRPCFSGPAGSDQVAPCHAGVQRCEVEGWGACEGERVPAEADCDAPGDETCGTAARCPGEPLRSMAFAGEDVRTTALAVEPGGDLYLAGGFRATLDFDRPLEAKTPHDTFLVRLRPNGERVWGRRFGAGDEDQASLAVDDAGDVTLTVLCPYVIDLGNGKLWGELGEPAFGRMTPDGTARWSQRMAGPRLPLLAAPGTAGETWLAGALDGVVDLGDGPVAHPGWADVLVLAVAPDGEILRSAHFGDLGHQAATAIAVAPDGDVVIAGEFSGTLDFGLGPLQSGGYLDIFVARLAPDLTPRWAISFPALGYQSVANIVADERGVAIAGTYANGFDLGGGRLNELGAPGTFDPAELVLAPQGFIAAFDPEGQHRWSHQLGIRAAVSVDALRPGPDEGYILAGAQADAGAIFGGTHLGAAEGAWVAVYGSDGANRWRWSFGGSEDAYMWSPTPVLSGDEIVIAVAGSGVFDLGGGPIGQADEDSLFLAAFAP